LLIVLSFKFRVIRLRNGLTILLISDLEEANNDNMKYKDYEENCSSANRIKKDVEGINKIIQLVTFEYFYRIIFYYLLLKIYWDNI